MFIYSSIFKTVLFSDVFFFSLSPSFLTGKPGPKVRQLNAINNHHCLLAPQGLPTMLEAQQGLASLVAVQLAALLI